MVEPEAIVGVCRRGKQPTRQVERLCDSVVVVAHGRTVASGSVAELLEQTGESDFEEAFVKLAFVDARAGEGSAA